MSDGTAGLPADTTTAAAVEAGADALGDAEMDGILARMTYSPKSRRRTVALAVITAAGSVIAADAARQERQRIRAYVTERIRELQAMGWSGQGETVPQSELRMVLGLLEDAP